MIGNMGRWIACVESCMKKDRIKSYLLLNKGWGITTSVYAVAFIEKKVMDVLHPTMNEKLPDISRFEPWQAENSRQLKLQGDFRC